MLHSHGIWEASHDHGLVALSVVIAILASYVALELVSRVTAATGRGRAAWLLGGAVAMGTGIWSMHYVGMLAFKLPVLVRYHWPTVALSHIAAIVASAVALVVTSRRTMGLRRAALGSVFMGVGIAGMHYIGMAAMRLPATSHYSPPLVALSIVLAIGIAFVALWLAFELREDASHFNWRRINSAVVMGLAIPVMHYTGMAAVSFTPSPGFLPDLSRAVNISALGTLGIIGVTFMVLGLTVVSSMVERRMAAQVLREDLLLRRSATQLRDDAERREFILSAAGIGMWEHDLVSGAIVWSNTMESIYGRSRAAFPKTLDGFLALVHPDDRGGFAKSFHGFLQEGTEHTKEFRVVWPDGSIHWLESTARVRRNSSGRPVSVFGVDQDITRRRLLEEHFRQTQKMEAIGHLAGGVAHDFNNLLTAIVGFSELIVEHPEADAKIRSDAGEILNAAQSGAALTRQLLAFSRRQTLEPQILNLKNVIGTMEGLMRRLIGEQVDLVTEVEASLWPVNADKGQIEQVVINLAVNARDAMPSGGTLRITASNVELDDAFVVEHPGSAHGPHVRIAVTDTGIGMDGVVRSHLFEPFFTTKDRGKGTGLGLATVYGIVQQSHGYIAVESQIGRGSTFAVYLPQAAGEASTHLPEVHAGANGSETILLVEDQEEVRRVTHETLVRRGYTVLSTASAREALAVLADATVAVDLLLTDVVMPGMDGRELGRRAAKLQPHLRVLYMSGYAHVIADPNGNLEPGLQLLQKPFTTSALLQKIRSVLDAVSAPASTSS